MRSGTGPPKGGPGVDTAFDAGQMQVGRRLAIKLLNASKFVLGRTAPVGPVTDVDRPRHADAAVRRSCATATSSLETYDYTTALRETETFFWWFCDDHIEHVKRRRERRHAGRGVGDCRVACSRST